MHAFDITTGELRDTLQAFKAARYCDPTQLKATPTDIDSLTAFDSEFIQRLKDELPAYPVSHTHPHPHTHTHTHTHTQDDCDADEMGEAEAEECVIRGIDLRMVLINLLHGSSGPAQLAMKTVISHDRASNESENGKSPLSGLLILIVNCLAYFWSSGEFPVPHADGTCVSASLNSLHMIPSGAGRGHSTCIGFGVQKWNLVYIHVHAPILYMLYTHACVYIHFHYLVSFKNLCSKFTK